MPDVTVALPDGSTIAFPQGTPPDVMSKAAASQWQKIQAKQTSAPAPPPAASSAPDADPNLLAAASAGGVSGAQPDYRNITRDPVQGGRTQTRAGGGEPLYSDPVTGERVGPGPINVYDKFRMDFFNTTNPKANVPIQTAYALSKNPNDPDTLARLSRMSPIAQVAIRDKAQELANAPVYEAPSNPAAMGAIGTYRDPHTGERVSMGQILPFVPSAIPLPHDIIGEMLHGHEGYEQLKKAQGVVPEVTRLAEGLLDPESLATMLGGGALGALGKIGTLAGKTVTGSGAVAGAFAALGTKQAIDKVHEGDYGGAAVDMILGMAPTVAHIKAGGLAKAAGSVPAVTDIGDLGVTRGSTTPAAPAPVDIPEGTGKITPKRPFDVAPNVLDQISEHNASIDKEKTNVAPGTRGSVPRSTSAEVPVGMGDRDSTDAQRTAQANPAVNITVGTPGQPLSGETRAISSAITPEQVSGAAKDGFTKAADLYAQAKAEEPNLTREEFAQRLYDFHKAHAQDGGGFNYEGPSGDVKPADVFTATTADGRRVRYYGFNEKTGGKVTPAEAAPVAPPESEFNSDSSVQTGTKLANAHVLAERRAQGLPDFPTDSTDSRTQAYEKAFANAAPETALSVAEDVRKSPRAMTLQELVDNSLKHREVKADIADVTDQIKRGVEAGRDTSDLQAKYDSLLADKHALTDASYLSGTDQSHAFAFRQHILEDYTPEDLQKRLELARPEVAPTPKEKAAVAAIADQHAQVEKAIDEHAAQTPDEADSQAAGQRIVEEIQSEEKKQSRRTQRASSKADLDTEYQDLIKQWVKKSTGQANAGIPIDPESVRILRDMAKNRVKAGALTVADVVDHLHEAVTQTIPDATKRQVRDWWTGYGQGSKIPRGSTLADLKEQARWMSKIEDVNKPLPKSAPRAVSDAVKALREEYKAAKAGNEAAKSPEEIEQARVEKRIEGLKKQLAGKVEATPHLATVDTEEMSGMRKELKSLQDDLAARKKKAGPSPPSPEQLTQVRMQRRIDLIEEKIKSGNVLPDKKPELTTVDTERTAELRTQLDAAETRLKELQKAARPAAVKADPLENYRTKLQVQIDDLSQNIDAGTPENVKKATVQKRVYDKQTQDLITERNRLRKQADAIIESRKTKSRLQKFADYHRFAILSRPSTLGKLGAAAMERVVFDPLEDIADRGLGATVPGYRNLANMAPNARGSIAATAKGISTTFSREAIRDARVKLKTGMNSLDARLGDPKNHLEMPNWKGFWGRLHGAVKTPLQLGAYEKSIVKQSAWAERNGMDLNDISVRNGIEARAYLESKRSIFMQDNNVASAFHTQVEALDNNKELGPAGEGFAAIGRFLFPIVQVPTNFIGEVGLHAGGVFRAAGEIAAAKAKGVTEGAPSRQQVGEWIMTKGTEHMTPEQADIVVRSLKKNAVGAALFAIGYYNADNFGGYYQKGGNKHNDLETGSVKIHMFGRDLEVPHVLLHSPQMEVMTMGAAFRQAMDNWRSGKSSETQVGDSVGSVAKGVSEIVPFVSLPQYFFDATESPKKGATFTGKMVGGAIVPGLLPDVAAGLDKDSRGRTKKRTPQGFMDAIKMSAGARQSVPEGRR